MTRRISDVIGFSPLPYWISRLITYVGLAIALLPSSPTSLAQSVATNITATSGSGGLATEVTKVEVPEGTAVENVYEITKGTRRDANLFHSFDRFSVGSADVANFRNETGAHTSNILSRVTGGHRSDIFGTIKTTDFPGANLYLLNPAGVVFGPNASLNVEGSFHVSTADYLRFQGGEFKFFADPLKKSSLSTVRVEAFGFLAGNPKPITFEPSGQVFEVPADQALSIIGGEITLAGHALQARGGEINIVSVAEASSGTEIVNSSPETPFEVHNAPSLGTVTIKDATLEVGVIAEKPGNPGVPENGPPFFILPTDPTPGEPPDGRGGMANIQGGILILDNTTIKASTAGHIDGAEVAINLDTTHTISIKNGTEVLTTAENIGGGGDVVVATPHLTAMSDTQIRTSTTGEGNAGDVIINAGLVELKEGAEIESKTLATGEGGVIVINVNELNLSTGAKVVSQVQTNGMGGNISVNGLAGPESNADSVSLAGENTGISSNGTGEGTPGDILLNVRSLKVTDGAGIKSGGPTFNKGGSVTVRAIEDIEISNRGQISSQAFFEGLDLNIDVTSQDLLINDGIISTSTRGRSDAGTISLTMGNGVTLIRGGKIESTTSAEGKGGPITVNTAKLSVDNATISASTFGEGEGGSVDIHAAEVFLTNGAKISAESQSDDANAKSGDIAITASDTLRVFNNSSISVETQQATAGNINLKVGSLIHLKDKGRITTSAGGGTGDGGNINIDPDFVVLEGGSEIIARAKEGSGGNINIVTGFLFRSPDSVIDASSETGIDGNINIDSPDTDIIPGTVQLPSNLLNAAALLSEPCFAKKLSNSSSLVVADQTGIPPGPDNMLSAQTEYRFDQAPPATLKSNASSEQPQVSALNSPPFANYIVSSKSPDTPCNSL